jgi:hypothetical protein
MNKSTTLCETINRIKQNSGMLIFEADINEINWEKDFQDVSKKCINPNELTAYLNKVVTNSQQKPADRDKLALDRPYIHSKTIPFDEEGEINVDEFIKKITAMPNDILSINMKMEKSKTDDSFSVNIGIPALRGLVYDIENSAFYIVNTCPGAGTCAMICYARKGSYVMFPDVFLKQTKILNLLLNYPERFEKLLTRELESIALKNPDKQILFRWNDAGDFFTKKYYEIALRITNNLKSEGYNINSYAYTKMGDVVNMADPNFIVNFSNDANKKETSKVIDVEGSKQSVIVPKELFDDLLEKTPGKSSNYLTNEKGKVVFSKPENVNILKQRLASKYGVDVKSILTYDELLSTPVGAEKQYNVVIMPKGDGDRSAQRSDVKMSFLCFH